jgi:hypothetical protein
VVAAKPSSDVTDQAGLRAKRSSDFTLMPLLAASGRPWSAYGRDVMSAFYVDIFGLEVKRPVRELTEAPRSGHLALLPSVATLCRPRTHCATWLAAVPGERTMIH